MDSWTTDEKAPVSSTQLAIVTTSELESEDATLEETSSLTSSETPFEAKQDTRQEEEAESLQSRSESLQPRSESLQLRTEDTSVDKVDSSHSHLGEETISSSVSDRMRIFRSQSRSSVSSEETPRGQRGSRRSKKKKGSRRVTEVSESEAKEGQRTVSDEDRLVDEASRAITEIPEVTVVGGGSFVPKDLCSTGILTSRVLTAPSRATYTTAYI
ncbi:uncharacterized protein LOC143181793 [Calliopsis andreniformis]|uniref:uncharacterized protein LOC143181793 n=1 Tax=Calliopsis andreniformis TaxID=337506 RepID=UPI003FCCCC1F